MHKSAMQQIQQIPRVGLGPGGMGADSKPHQCQQCLKSFSSNHQLVQHIRVHTGEKPYKCSYCDRRFKQLSHVQQHTRLHTGERPYKCHLPDCGRAFIQLSNLQQHLRNHDAQVERAKNRPFHCNICGKGFATESSLRTHTSKELQLHLGVLQQHAALIGGPNATSCPICHKLFLGGEALMEHMKHAHKDPNASGVAISPDFQFKNELVNPSNSSPPPPQQQNQLASHQTTTNAKTCSFSVKKTYPFAENLGSTCLQSNDPYLAKRRTANHPCPVCGKHYVNEGSLRKHLACHPETSQLTSSLRMWPCSVCQAVFTHENGLLTHMEHMRMDPKHQFAAQYVLSRAAAERRERDSILAATLAVSASGSSMLPLGGPGSGEGGGGGSNSMCPSPSANSECSSNGRLSSAGSDPGSSLLQNNNNNNCNSKLSDILRSSHTTHMHPQYGVDDIHANRMSLMAAAAAGIVSQSNGNAGVSGGMVSPVDTSAGAVVQAAVVNLAAAMRMNQQVNSTGSVSGTAAGTSSGNGNLNTNPQPVAGSGPVISSSPTSLSNVDTAATAVAAMNAMRVTMAADSMMRSTMGVDPIAHQNTQHHQQHHQQNSPEAALRIQQAEAILRSQAEAAIRLAVSVAASSNNGNANSDHATNVRINNGPTFGGSTTVPPIPQNNSSDSNHNTGNSQSQQQNPPESLAASSSNNISQQQQQSSHQHSQQHQQQLQPAQQQQSQVSPDLSEAIRLQEHRLEQALRLHNDVRALNFLSTAGSNGAVAEATSVSHQQQQQQQQSQQQQQPHQQQHQPQHHQQLQQHHQHQQQQHNNTP